MVRERGNGEGGLHWDERRARWVATVTAGFDARGKRVVRRKYAKTKQPGGMRCGSWFVSVTRAV